MILDGKACSENLLQALKEEIGKSGLRPRLATLIAGSDPGSQMYIRMKHRACEKVGIGSVAIDLPADVTTDRVLQDVRHLNDDPDIDGILVQLPLPASIQSGLVIRSIRADKDVDGFHPCNLGLLFAGSPRFIPCTPKGIMTLLEKYHIGVSGQHAVVVGRSIDVGRPMAALFSNADATVTLCHSRTRNLSDETRRADILVSAVGKPDTIRAGMVKEGAVVIDVGINQVGGKLVGDVDFASVRDIASAITPVPGGVGPMTIATLMENTFLAAKWRVCDPVW
jgi:methylenetetrahydrofolate dehydrogenase (NADP+)/methenyltetrahydrofolate cyclohydrolase